MKLHTSSNLRNTITGLLHLLSLPPFFFPFCKFREYFFPGLRRQ
jgi:hypothetical protein